MSGLSRPSAAKINLLLRVGPRRADGYHAIESLVVQIPLYDTVTVADAGVGRISVECDDPAVPQDKSNLAAAAVRELAACCGVQRGARIRIQKRIPAGAGLGGGSSNAAAALVLANELWGLRLTRKELVEIGARVGADVPLFLHGPVTAVRGRGEIVRDLDMGLNGWVVLVVPRLRTSTREVYAAFDRLDPRPPRPGLDEVLAAVGYAGKGERRIVLPAEVLAPRLFNDLEPAALAAEPELARLYSGLAWACPGALRMTGSGSALFALKNEPRDAERLAGRLAEVAGAEATTYCLALPR